VRPRAKLPPEPRTYGGKSKEAREQERRERLLATGLELFGTEGYAATTIERICVHAGVTARHFYEQFDSREALLRAVYDHVVEELQRSVLEALASSSGDERARIAQTLERFLHTYLDDPRKARIAVLEAVGVSAAFERHRREVIGNFATVIRLQAEALSARIGGAPHDFRVAAMALAGGVNEVIADWLFRGGKDSVESIVRALVDLFLAAIEGAELVDARRGRPDAASGARTVPTEPSSAPAEDAAVTGADVRTGARSR
jgi:AcrR family transcriptional regulator